MAMNTKDLKTAAQTPGPRLRCSRGAHGGRRICRSHVWGVSPAGDFTCYYHRRAGDVPKHECRDYDDGTVHLPGDELAHREPPVGSPESFACGNEDPACSDCGEVDCYLDPRRERSPRRLPSPRRKRLAAEGK